MIAKSTEPPSLLLLGALSLFLASVEMLIPKPLPFLKLGLANLPVLLFIRLLPLKKLMLVGMIKVVGQGILAANLLSYIGVFSFGSTVASVLSMWLVAQLPSGFISFLGISIIGAIASSLMQLIISLQWIFPDTATLLVPWSLGFGAASGFFMGIFAMVFASQSQWYRLYSK